MAEYDPGAFTPFAVTVDIVLLAVADNLQCLLVRRDVEPFRGELALPGGFVLPNESIVAAAHRELREETGLTVGGDVHLEQLATFGAVGRDPRMRVVSVAYLGLTASIEAPRAGTDAAEAVWMSVDGALSAQLAFDHHVILVAGVERARGKLEYTTLATRLAGPDFTLGELHEVYETVWGRTLNLANFRRKVLATEGFVVATTRKRSSAAGGPAATVYEAGPAESMVPPLLRGA